MRILPKIKQKFEKGNFFLKTMGNRIIHNNQKQEAAYKRSIL